MKIGLVHRNLDLRGGTEKDLLETSIGLARLGHEVHLFCGEYDVSVPVGIVAHTVPVAPLGRTIRLWSFALSARKAIRESGCDAVVNFGRFVEADVLRCGGGTHYGFLQRMGKDGGWGRRAWQAISAYHQSLLAMERRQFGCPRLKKIIAVSRAVKNDIMANYGVAEEKIAVLYNGVDHCRFSPHNPPEHRCSVRRRWNIPVDAPLVLFVGSGFRRKGLDRMISLWSSRQFSGIYLLVIGSDARIDRYRAWADSVAPGRIMFAGHQSDVEHYYAAADLLALFSLQEAFGNVVLEALAAGLPVALSRNVGAAELLQGSLLEGVIDRPDDPNELAAQLLKVIDKSRDPALRRQARQIGEAHSWENHFREFDAILLKTCGRK